MTVKQLIIFSCILLIHKMCAASMQIPLAREMYQQMDYQQIFNQQLILEHSTFQKVLIDEGIKKENVLLEASFQQSQPLEIEINGNTIQNSWNLGDCLCFKMPNNGYSLIPDRDDRIITSKDLDSSLIRLFKKNKEESLRHAIYMPCCVQGIPACVFGMSATGLALIGMHYQIAANGLIFAAGLISTNALYFTSSCFMSSGTAYYRIYYAPTNDPIHQFEELYAKRKRFLAPSIQNAIESKFGAFRKSNVSETAILDYCKIVLNLPIRSKEPNPQFEKIEEYLLDYEIDEENLSPMLKSNGVSIQDIIINAIVHHIASYTSRKGENPKIKNILFLQGLPGIGKTKMVQEIARFMGIPLISIDLGSADQVRIMGTNSNPGILLEGLTKLPKDEDESIRNSFLFLDEMDRIVNQPEYRNLLTSLLPFFEPSTKSIYNAYLGADIDISHYFIIGAGNSVPNDPALKDRMTIVPIKGFKKGKKAEILKKKLPSMLSSSIESYNLSSFEKISELEGIIDHEEETDPDPGLRSIEKILTYRIAQDRYINRK